MVTSVWRRRCLVRAGGAEWEAGVGAPVAGLAPRLPRLGGAQQAQQEHSCNKHPDFDWPPGLITLIDMLISRQLLNHSEQKYNIKILYCMINFQGMITNTNKY